MAYKLQEKIFLDNAVISNMSSLILKSRFVDNCDNEALVDESLELAVLMLKKRNELFGESTKKETVKKTIPEVDIDDVIDIFNQVCSELPRVMKTTKERERLVFKILETYTLQDIGLVFKLVSESDYLNGKVKKWQATFDWIFTPSNFIKILEGSYKNHESAQLESKEQKFGRMSESTVQKNFTTFLNSVPDGKQ